MAPQAAQGKGLNQGHVGGNAGGASCQGEGLFVGEPETFLRLAGCPLRCRYCDTAHSWVVAPDAERLTPFGAMVRVAEVELDPRRPIAVTGGEPTLWPDFLLGLADVAGDRPLRLETAGQDLAALERVLPRFDHLSLDLKLGADLAPPVPVGTTGEPDDLPAEAAAWDSLRPRQLALATAHVAAGGTAALKLVVTPGTDPAAFDSQATRATSAPPRGDTAPTKAARSHTDSTAAQGTGVPAAARSRCRRVAWRAAVPSSATNGVATT